MSLMSATVLPMSLASCSMSASSVGTNSCSGGSRKRMVTGRPSRASYMRLEVALLHGLELGQSGLSRCSTVSEQIISRMAAMRSASKNMCSVRHRPMPSAPNLHGLRGVVGGIGVGADLQTAILVGPAHDAAELAADGGVDGGDGAVVDVAGGAVDGDASRPRGRSCRRASNFLFSSSILMSPQPETQHLPMPRATTAAWEVMPPRTVRMP